MKKSFRFIPVLAVLFAFMAAYASPASAETINSYGLLSKLSGSILVWDAASDTFTTQKVSYAEDKSVLNNHVAPIMIQIAPDPVLGDIAYVEGSLRLSNHKVYMTFNGYVTASDSKAAGNCWVYVRMVTDGDIVFDASGNVASGSGHIVYFDCGAYVQIAAKQDSGGNMVGAMKFTVSPYDGTYEEYSAGTAVPGSDVSTAVRVKLSAIKFQSYELLP